MSCIAYHRTLFRARPAVHTSPSYKFSLHRSAFPPSLKTSSVFFFLFLTNDLMTSERIRSSSPRSPRARTENRSFPRCMTDCHRPLLYHDASDPSSDRRLSLDGTSPSHYYKIDPNLGLSLRAFLRGGLQNRRPATSEKRNRPPS